MWSISCNIQHLAQQQGQNKIQWSMLRKRTFHHFRQANMANQQSIPPDDVFRQIMATVAWWQKGFRALGVLCSLRSKKKLAGEKRWATDFVSNQEREKLIEDYVERESAVATQRVQDAETAMMQEQEHMGNDEKGWSTTTKPEITFEEMLNAIGDSLSDLASSEDEEDGEDEDDDEEDPGHGKQSEDDEPGWVMGTLSNTVQHSMESIWQKLMRLDQLTQPWWGDAANYFHEGDVKYGMTELKVPAVRNTQTDSTAATPSPTTFGELMQALDSVPGQSQMPQVMPRQGISQMRLGLEKPQSENHIVPPIPASVLDSLQIEIAKPVQPGSFYPCI